MYFDLSLIQIKNYVGLIQHKMNLTGKLLVYIYLTTLNHKPASSFEGRICRPIDRWRGRGTEVTCTL